MKSKNLTLFGRIFLLIWIVFCVLAILVLRNAHLYEPTVISIKDPFACTQLDGQWEPLSTFQTGQAIYICGYITFSNPESGKEIQTRIYRDEYTFGEKEIFYNNILITGKDDAVFVDTYLLPGMYVIKISSGRKVLGEIPITVIDN